MKESIKKRIEAVRRGEVPEGYRRAKDIGIAPADWKVGQLSDVLHNEPRPVSKPNNPYWRLGIRSWAKGTFRAYVDDPAAVDMGELYIVRENDLVVNITFAWEHAIAVASKEDDGLLVSHRFPTYVFDRGNVPAYYKAVVSQQYFKDMLDHISPGGAGRNRVLNRKDFLALPCHVPPVAEQQKIAEILEACDRMIELKQSKIDELNKLKQVCQLEMFPQKGQTIPQRRFPGFSAPWEQRKFEEIAVRSSVICSDANLPRVEYEDIVSGAGRLNKDIYAKQSSKSGIAFHQGDVLYGKLRPYLQNWLLPTFDGLAVGDFWVLQPQNADSNFLYRLIQSRQFDEVANQSTGTKMPRADWKLVSKTVFSIPSNISEQAAIGTYFTAFDNLITLHQRELAEVEKYKKALMQLLLTGLVRVNA